MKTALALLASAPLAIAANQHAHEAAPQAKHDPAAVCQDRIRQVREERGLPRLDRRATTPDQTYFIAAVDKRIDGCSVMVMRNDMRDVRPLPEPVEQSVRLLPARQAR